MIFLLKLNATTIRIHCVLLHEASSLRLPRKVTCVGERGGEGGQPDLYTGSTCSKDCIGVSGRENSDDTPVAFQNLPSNSQPGNEIPCHVVIHPIFTVEIAPKWCKWMHLCLQPTVFINNPQSLRATGVRAEAPNAQFKTLRPIYTFLTGLLWFRNQSKHNLNIF